MERHEIPIDDDECREALHEIARLVAVTDRLPAEDKQLGLYRDLLRYRRANALMELVYDIITNPSSDHVDGIALADTQHLSTRFNLQMRYAMTRLEELDSAKRS